MKKLLLILFVSSFSFGQTAEDYFDSGVLKAAKKDYYSSIVNYKSVKNINYCERV